MKFSKALISTLLIVVTNTNVLARGARPPKPSNPVPPSTDTFIVNPKTLRDRLLDENMDIAMAAQRVATAKTQLNLARSNLFPSINLGTLLLSAGGANFLLSSVDVLLPFLLPSTWFELRKASLQLEADRQAFQAVQLNVYASLWSLYHAILNDQALLEQLKVDAEDWKVLEEKTAERFQWGLVTRQEMALATSQRALAELRMEKVSDLMVDEMAGLRKALGLELSQPIVLESSEIPLLDEESWELESLRDSAVKMSPELNQLRYLEQSSIAERWNRVFGFIVGASIFERTFRGESVTGNFDQFYGAVSAHFGLAQFPGISLNSRQIEAIRLQKIEVQREISRLAEVVKKHQPNLQKRHALAQEAEDALRSNFDRVLEKYRLGLGVTLTDVLKARIGIFEATVENIRAKTDLQINRISLMRMLRIHEFALVDGCHYPVLAKKQRGALTPDGRIKICTKTPPAENN